MKIVFTVLLFSALFAPLVSAQKNSSTAKASTEPCPIEEINMPARLQGTTNYLVSFSDKKLNSNSCVFYTDSNATVAYLRVNGNNIRLSGGPNAEGIMAYACKGYTVTLDIGKKPSNLIGNTGNYTGVKIEGNLTLYSNTQTVVKKVTGIQINGAKN